MEIYPDKDKKYISVWLTNEEQKHCDRKSLTARLLKMPIILNARLYTFSQEVKTYTEILRDF